MSFPPTTPDWVSSTTCAETSRSRPVSFHARTSVSLGPRSKTSHQLHRGGASAEATSERFSPRSEPVLARGIRRRVADRRTHDGRRRPGRAAPNSSTRQTSTPRSRGSRSSPARRLENTASAVVEHVWRTSRRATGTPWLKRGRQLSGHRSSKGRERPESQNGRDAVVETMRTIAEIVSTT